MTFLTPRRAVLCLMMTSTDELSSKSSLNEQLEDDAFFSTLDFFDYFADRFSLALTTFSDF